MKKHILVIMCILLCGVLFAEEVLFVTTEDIFVRKDGAFIKTFPKDTKVILTDSDVYALYKSIITDRDGCIENVRNTYYSRITVDGEEYYVEAKNIIPIDTPDLFDESFLTVAHYPSRYLIASYFADVLKSGTRSTMYKYEKDYIEGYIRVSSEEYDDPWWMASGLTDESIITQSVIHIRGIGSVLVKKNRKNI